MVAPVTQKFVHQALYPGIRKSDNQYDRKLLEDEEPVEAIYIDSGTESDALNPFIAALPPAKEDDT